ncbi:hypothetical protein HYW94_00055 [Candidatus Uhrbacteria bacterium]|nr:hypothetical protein [Candidatus Uhrbacteria bacterium]
MFEAFEREERARKYRNDPREQPTDVKIITNKWEELIEALQDCESQFFKRKQSFWCGEEYAYADELKKFREKILPVLIEKIGERSVSVMFQCSPHKMGSAEIKVEIDEFLKLKVFSQFYDGFSLPTNMGEVTSYTYQNLNRSRTIVHHFTLVE